MNNSIEIFPSLEHRKDPDTKPIYKIIARSMTLSGDSVVMLHKSGNDFVENYFLRDLIINDVIMANLDKKEAELLRWVVHSEDTNPLEA